MPRQRVPADDVEPQVTTCPCLYVRGGPAGCARADQHTVQRGAQLGPRGAGARGPRAITSSRGRAQLRQTRAQRFAQAASHAVAHHGVADATAHRDARRACGRGHSATTYSTSRRCGQPRGAASRTRPKIGRRAQPLLALHRASRWRCPRRRRLDDSQALAPAQAAALEDGTAGGGEHAFEEAVLPFARDALRLVGTLGHGRSVLGTAGRTGLARSAAWPLTLGLSKGCTVGTSANCAASIPARSRPPVEAGCDALEEGAAPRRHGPAEQALAGVERARALLVDGASVGQDVQADAAQRRARPAPACPGSGRPTRRSARHVAPSRAALEQRSGRRTDPSGSLTSSTSWPGGVARARRACAGTSSGRSHSRSERSVCAQRGARVVEQPGQRLVDAAHARR